MTERTRFCLIGCGGIGIWHIKAVSEIPGAELVAVADVNEKQMNRVVRRFRIPAAFTDYKEMYDKVEPDVALIATPVFLHAPMTIEAAGRGINVLCEKPISRNLDEAKAMVDACRKTGVHLSHMNNWRHAEVVQRVVEIMESEKVGPIHSMYMSYASPGSEYLSPGMGEWVYDKEKAGGGVLLDSGYHSVDVINYLFGEIKTVSAEVATLVKQGNVDDIALIVFQNEKGLLGMLKLSWIEHTPMDQAGACVKLYGTRGLIDVQLQHSIITVTTRDPRLVIEMVDTSDLMVKPGYVGHRLKIANFLAVMRGDDEARERDIDELLRVAATLEAVYQSAAEGKRVKVSSLL
ncbi:MAG: gfo/Idh/MocA family oxidoreductase [Actinobacteria bacterium]|nr:MAG: gfo/Idh/MocA family oxidoreductase [Actinomycetota bacterium]